MAFAMLKAEMLAVAASSGAWPPKAITRICIGGTLANDVTPKMNAAARNGHFCVATNPTMSSEATYAIVRTTPPSTRSAAPVVADACALQT